MTPRILLCWLLLSLLGACGVEHREILSALSPDGNFIATASDELAGGPTIPAYQAVYLAPVLGDRFAGKVLGGRDLKIADLRWEGRILTVTYTQGDVYAFAAGWQAREGRDRKMEVRLNPRCAGLCILGRSPVDTDAPEVRIREEVAAATSPNGAYDAVLTAERNAIDEEAIYRLRIFTSKETQDEKWAHMLVEAKNLAGSILEWDAAMPVLKLSYTGGEVLKFQNAWRDPVAYREGRGSYNIEVRLDPRCTGMCF